MKNSRLDTAISTAVSALLDIQNTPVPAGMTFAQAAYHGGKFARLTRNLERQWQELERLTDSANLSYADMLDVE